MFRLQKKHVGYVLGAVFSLSLAFPVVLGFVNPIHAAEALKGDQLFGGTSGSDAAFAGEAGLGAAKLVPTITSIIRMALGFLGIIAVVVLMLGGFKWMTSGGNEENVKKAKKLIYSGIIGLVIVLAAYAIATFVITQITDAMSKS